MSVTTSECPALVTPLIKPRLRRRFEALLRSARSVTILPPIPQIDTLLEEQGLNASCYCSFRVGMQDITATIVCVEDKYWRDVEIIKRFKEVKRIADALGHTLLMVPGSLVERHWNQHGVTMSDVRISASDRLNVVRHLLLNGRSTLSQVAAQLRHPEPIPAVLQLAVAGILDIDLDAPIFPGTLVSMSHGQ